VVLPIPEVAVYVKFSDNRPISLLACLSKVFEILMGRQIQFFYNIYISYFFLLMILFYLVPSMTSPKLDIFEI
jgi:hypothetical protein